MQKPTVSVAYRLELPLLGIEKFNDGKSRFFALASGTQLTLTANEPKTSLVEVTAGGKRVWVFRADLEERATRVPQSG
jgi:hypothetical protein